LKRVLRSGANRSRGNRLGRGIRLRHAAINFFAGAATAFFFRRRRRILIGGENRLRPR
jgi:hypothetical protein